MASGKIPPPPPPTWGGWTPVQDKARGQDLAKGSMAPGRAPAFSPVGGRAGAGGYGGRQKQKETKIIPLPAGTYTFKGVFNREERTYRIEATGPTEIGQPKVITWDGECSIQIGSEVESKQGFMGVNANINGTPLLLVSEGEGRLGCAVDLPKGTHRVSICTDLTIPREAQDSRFEMQVYTRTREAGVLVTNTLHFMADMARDDELQTEFRYEPKIARFVAG
jgi:hypothetical protein